MIPTLTPPRYVEYKNLTSNLIDDLYSKHKLGNLRSKSKHSRKSIRAFISNTSWEKGRADYCINKKHFERNRLIQVLWESKRYSNLVLVYFDEENLVSEIISPTGIKRRKKSALLDLRRDKPYLMFTTTLCKEIYSWPYHMSNVKSYIKDYTIRNNKKYDRFYSHKGVIYGVINGKKEVILNKYPEYIVESEYVKIPTSST